MSGSSGTFTNRSAHLRFVIFSRYGASFLSQPSMLQRSGCFCGFRARSIAARCSGVNSTGAGLGGAFTPISFGHTFLLYHLSISLGCACSSRDHGRAGRCTHRTCRVVHATLRRSDTSRCAGCRDCNGSCSVEPCGTRPAASVGSGAARTPSSGRDSAPASACLCAGLRGMPLRFLWASLIAFRRLISERQICGVRISMLFKQVPGVWHIEPKRLAKQHNVISPAF
ncbi:hypothetical protein HOV04_gp63 [Xanthomonas phage XcP1]|uniref:Uncharacterized protein n=1 Tax=Xanthomonas phage XcP1 TaxID=2785027 RepID=A0A3S7L8M9_9CAUD|nr:hypothetical protein HOV04_gp63 [Xanthomonas phage XcP1]AWN08565.1 hypothetical protein XcP1_063 [Xanthomonas phage XcP1]